MPLIAETLLIAVFFYLLGVAIGYWLIGRRRRSYLEE
jgi:uncharacterized protein YneF (UPF0154 family)